MIINGTAEAKKIRTRLEGFIKSNHITPTLAIIRIGNDEASGIYIKFKEQYANEIGIKTIITHLDETASTNELIDIINNFNDDISVNGIIVQMPLPNHIDKELIVSAISPIKDVDGFHPENFGKLSLGLNGMVSCTPMGCLHLIKTIIPDISGLNAVVIGRSIIVGKPMSLILLNENATVTTLHSQSNDIATYTKTADIIVACTGYAKLIKKDMVKDGVILIDVGVTRTTDGKIIGDSDFDEIKDKALAITPPIGGVGPMTIAMLLYNTVKAYSKQNNISGFNEKYSKFI